MPSLAEKIRFAETYVTTPDGEPFSLEGRQWVLDEIWRPLDGWKLWPVNVDRLCPDCAALANTITEDYGAAAPTQTKDHARDCDGLAVEPVLIVAAKLKRQSGKTFNTAAWAMSRAFKDDRESVALLAGSEDQVARLYNKNYKRPIETNARLAKMARCLGTRIVIDKTKSEIEILPTSMSSVGDTRTAVVIDECRIVPPDIAVALIPTLFARGGWHCPRYHFRTHQGVEDQNAPQKCSVCGAASQPWYGKALLLSSAGELDDSDGDWFFEFITHYAANPHKNVHIFTSEETLNPKISQKLVNVTADVFGAIESTRVFADIEATNRERRKHEEFLSRAEVERCEDSGLVNMPECSARCYGFLDTSTSREKTALVIIADESATGMKPWAHVFTPRIDFWIPAEQAHGRIDGDAVTEHVGNLLPLYPGLVELWIDVRGDIKWPRDALLALKAKAPKKIKAWDRNSDAERNQGWDELEARYKARTIRTQKLKEVREEFRGATKKLDRGKLVVRDIDRAKMHTDITEAMACCCYLIAVDGSRSKIGMSGRTNRQSNLPVRVRVKAIETPKGPIVTRARFNPNGY